MFSSADQPGGGAAGATVVTTTTTTETTGTSENADNTKQLWKFLYVDMDFVKSLIGIFYAAEIILSMIGLICVSVPSVEYCDHEYGDSYSYYEFAASSCFVTSFLWYALYAFMVTKKLGFIRWDITEVIWCGFYAINMLIGSSIIAANVCHQGAYKAAAAFGFLCLFVLLGHGGWQAKNVWDRRPSNDGRTTTYVADGSQPYDVEEAGKY